MASGWWKSTHTNLAEVSPADCEVTTSLQAPRGFPKLASIATGAGLFLGGKPYVTIDNVIYYAGDDYVQDTDKPTLNRYDGTVHTDDGSFRGYIQWDQDECLSSDELDGENRDGEVSLRMGEIRSIERRSRNSSPS